jgi:hypothetical protein
MSCYLVHILVRCVRITELFVMFVRRALQYWSMRSCRVHRYNRRGKVSCWLHPTLFILCIVSVCRHLSLRPPVLTVPECSSILRWQSWPPNVSVRNLITWTSDTSCHVFKVTVDGVLDWQSDLLHLSTNYNWVSLDSLWLTTHGSLCNSKTPATPTLLGYQLLLRLTELPEFQHGSWFTARDPTP